MSNLMRLAVALAITAVTATGAFAASKHPRVYRGYSTAPSAYNAYPNLGAPARGWAYAAQAYWRAYMPAYNAYSYYPYSYNAYPYLGP